MVNVILVDGGGVLFNNVIEETDFLDEIAVLCGIDSAGLKKDYFSRESDFETGRMTACAVIDEIVTNCGGRHIPTQLIKECYGECVRALDNNIEGLLTYLSCEVRLPVVLANNEASDWDEIKHAKTGYWEMFDCLCSSWRLGAVKPDVRYFGRLKRVLRNASIQTAWILVDDSRDNCTATADAGGSAVMFNRYDSLIDILTAITEENYEDRRVGSSAPGWRGYGVR